MKPELTLTLDAMVYRLGAIKKACYRFGDKCCFHIVVNSNGSITVEISRIDEQHDLADCEQQFLIEILDQELREQVREETAAVRDLLLAQAFSPTSLMDPIGETAPFENDPLGIARPDGRQNTG